MATNDELLRELRRLRKGAVGTLEGLSLGEGLNMLLKKYGSHTLASDIETKTNEKLAMINYQGGWKNFRGKNHLGISGLNPQDVAPVTSAHNLANLPELRGRTSSRSIDNILRDIISAKDAGLDTNEFRKELQQGINSVNIRHGWIGTDGMRYPSSNYLFRNKQ